MAVNTFLVSETDTSYPSIYKYMTKKFYYDRKSDVYVASDSNDYKYIDPDSLAVGARGSIDPAEALSYILTEHKFYGGKYFGLDFYRVL